MANFSPYMLATQKRSYVIAFLRECTIQTPKEDRKIYTTALVPARYLTWLYNAWIDARGIDPFVKLTQERLTYILGTIDPSEDEIQKPKKSGHTRHAIICFDLQLNSEPIVSPREALELLGATNHDPFVIPGAHETPAALLNEITLLQGVLKRGARQALSARQRFNELTDDEKRPPLAQMSHGKHLEGALDADETEEVNPEPQEEEDEQDPNLASFSG